MLGKLSSWRLLKQKVLQQRNIEGKQQHVIGPNSFSVHVEKPETQNNVDTRIHKSSSMIKTSKIINQLGRLKRFIARKRPKQTHLTINVFSLHGYSSLKIQQDGPKACANKVVCVSWLAVCFQLLTIMAFTTYYQNAGLVLPILKLNNLWKADCSEIDRCHHFSRSMLIAGAKTNYICSAKLSKRLPLWSNAKHCAECPPLDWQPLNTSAKFGFVDETAAIYFHFWSERHTKLRTYQALDQSMHDINGPFSESCSLSRATNAFGHAGVDGSDHCVDCFGNACTQSSYSRPEIQNVMLASHCNERYACEAFDYDEGRCNKVFFDTVCKTSASVGEKPGYPRRFSDMPGFEWFRDWPHSLNDSCGLSANLTGLKAANGQVIGTEEQHRLRALCHLHTRCVREHPDRCNGKAEEDCPETEEARLRRDFVSEDVDTVFWTLPIPPLAHLYRHGGAILFPVAVFMFFVVSSEIAIVHVSATQYWMCLEIASQESKYDATRASRCSKAGRFAARVLLYMVRDCLVLYVLEPTVMSIVSVQTSFDIIFCGSIAVVVLQADQQLFSTIMTDASLSEISQEYSLVLTQRQHRRLQTELTVVFWNSIFWMMFSYIGTVQMSLVQTQSPEHPIDYWYTMMYGTIGFALTNDLLVEGFCLRQEISDGLKMKKREICCRLGVVLIPKSFAALLFLIIVMLLDILFYSRNPEMQAIFGDVKHHAPITEVQYMMELIT